MGDARLVTEWIPQGLCRFRRGRDPAVRLICFPSAGGTAAMFRPWASRLPDAIEVVAAEFAGRGARFADPLIRDLRQTAASLAPAVANMADRPYALFGQSMGALVAYELARQLRGGRDPVCAFLSACPAPHRIGQRRQLHRLPDRELLAEIARRGGTPQAVLNEPSLIALMLPIIRADLEMFETYPAGTRDTLPCDLVALCGNSDVSVGEDEVREWACYGDRGFALEFFPGGHFFIKSAEAPVLDSITRHLRTACSCASQL
jgi:medium-chain acyl-[acyl-carrier-protein] hydrolase